MASEQIRQHWQNPAISYDAGFYIMDDNDTWVDFSNHLSLQDRLAMVGSITHSVEGTQGAFQTSLGNVILSNMDGFFDKPFPMNNSPVLVNEFGIAASFTNTKNGSQSVLSRHKCKVTMITGLGEGHHEETVLGVFLIEKTTRDITKKTVSLKIAGLAKILKDADASKVRNGLGWYENRPARFLIEELVKVGHSDSSGALPDSYQFEDIISIPTHDGSIALSHYGSPPEFDGTKWLQIGKHPVAMIFGTVGSITDVLWIALEDELWYWDAATDKYTQAWNDTKLASGYTIRKIYIHSGKMWLMTTTDEPVSGTCAVTLQIYEYESAVGTPVLIITQTNVISGAAHYAAGEYLSVASVGKGISGQDTGINIDNRMNAGENFFAPFVQKAHYVNWTDYLSPDGTCTLNEGTSPFSDTDYSSLADAYVVPTGWWGYQTGAVDGVGPQYAYFRYWYGNDWTFCLNLDGDGHLCWIKVSAFNGGTVTDTFTLRKMNLSTEVVSDVAVINSAGAWPISMTAGTGSTKDHIVFISCQEQQSGNEASEGQLFIGLITASQVVEDDIFDRASTDWGDGNDDDYWVIVESVYSADDALLVGILLNRTTGNWIIHRNIEAIGLGQTTWNTKIIWDGVSQLKGLVYNSATGKCYCYEVGSGRIIEIDAGAATAVVLDGGIPAVYGVGELACAMTIDTGNEILYGITAPTPNPQSQLDGFGTGKYYLFKADTSITDRIEVAEFEDMNCWEAISKIAQAVDAVVGFNENGNFYFKPRTTTKATNAHFTLGDSTLPGYEEDIIQLRLDDGGEDIFNVASITPHSAELGEATADYRMIHRSGKRGGQDDDVPFVEFIVDSRTNARSVLNVTCVRSGWIHTGITRWKYSMVAVEVEVRLTVAATTAAETLSISSTYGGHSAVSDRNDVNGIQVDDFVTLTDPDTDNQTIRRISDVDADALTIDIDASVGSDGAITNTIPAGTTIIISKKNAIGTDNANSTWSDDGVTRISKLMVASDDFLYVSNADNLSVNTIIKVVGFRQHYRITEIEIDKDPTYFDKITLNRTLVATDVAPIGAVVTAFFSPNADDKWFEVGGTRIYIKFRKPSGGVESEDWTRWAVPGDTIRVDSQGSTSVALEHSKQTHISMNSVQKYGRREYPGITNKFIGRRIAGKLAAKLATSYNHPRYLITVVTNLRPDITMIAADGSLSEVDVYSPEAFPYREGFKERCLIRKIRHDLRTRKSTFVLKAIEPY